MCRFLCWSVPSGLYYRNINSKMEAIPEESRLLEYDDFKIWILFPDYEMESVWWIHGNGWQCVAIMWQWMGYMWQCVVMRVGAMTVLNGSSGLLSSAEMHTDMGQCPIRSYITRAHCVRHGWWHSQDGATVTDRSADACEKWEIFEGIGDEASHLHDIPEWTWRADERQSMANMQSGTEVLRRCFP